VKQRKSVKHNNRKLILDYMRADGILSISDISEQVKISKPTIKKVVDYYTEMGLVVSAGKGSSTDEGGKKPALFQFNRNYGYVIAVHIGPDFMYSAIMDLNAEIVHSTFRTIPKLSVRETVELLKESILDFQSLEWSRNKELINVVVALPGIVDSAKGVSVYTPHYPQWGENWPVRDVLLHETGLQVPLYIGNINRYQALAEKVKGLALGVNNFLIVDAMDEGVGAGVIVNGTIRHGSQNLSGEIGHMVLDLQGPKCICGGQGCFEALVSVRNINSILSTGNSDHKESLIYRENEDPEVGIDDLFRAAEAGDTFAVEVMNRIVSWFAIGLNNVIMVNDPDMIIIQGIYTHAGSRFLANLKNKIDQMSFPNLSRNVELVYSRFGRERGVLGAGCFGVWSYFQSKELYKPLIPSIE